LLAAARVSEVLRRVPDFTIREHCLPALHYGREEELDHHRDALRKAALPE